MDNGALALRRTTRRRARAPPWRCIRCGRFGPSSSRIALPAGHGCSTQELKREARGIDREIQSA
jgi:hypothetical protein